MMFMICHLILLIQRYNFALYYSYQTSIIIIITSVTKKRKYESLKPNRHMNDATWSHSTDANH